MYTYFCLLIYQAILNSGKQQRSHNGKNLLRSASLTYQFGANFTSPSQNLDEYHVSDMGTELDNVSNSVPQVTVSEVQSAVDKVSKCCTWSAIFAMVLKVVSRKFCLGGGGGGGGAQARV